MTSSLTNLLGKASSIELSSTNLPFFVKSKEDILWKRLASC